MPKYDSINAEINEKIKEDFKSKNQLMKNACRYSLAIRPDAPEKYNYVRSDFIKDIDRILHSPYYSRYTDKTQVFSFFRNDDITRRALHVQLVSRIARTIGAALNLNLDLIEAIALGHDIGHTPFGHAGESYLNDLYHRNTNKYFAHNLHSVRVLYTLIPTNLTLPTLYGILCHNGERGIQEYYPSKLTTFDDFNGILVRSYNEGPDFMSSLIANSLEGCLVRLCDMIAYVGKDRQDAYKASLISKAESNFSESILGTTNPEIINNLTCNIINCSYDKPYIALDPEYFNALIAIKDENSQIIYQNKKVRENYDASIKPMMEELYNKLLNDLIKQNTDSIIFKHHIDFIKKFKGTDNYLDTEPNQIVVDFIASMTDDYFIALYEEIVDNPQHKIEFYSYFHKHSQKNNSIIL